MYKLTWERIKGNQERSQTFTSEQAKQTAEVQFASAATDSSAVGY
ncbi:hypothetical protein [Microcoleus sp. F4-D5]